MSYDSSFMKIAANQAESNVGTEIGGPFGSVVVKDGKIIAEGHNQVLKSYDPTAHGEIVTIRHACAILGTHDLSGCELYTNAYPCPMCLSAIIWANIKVVYYGNTAKDADKIGFRDDYIYDFIQNSCEDPTVLTMEQHDRELTIKSFEKFNDSLDKKLY
ncbi:MULTISPECIES: nucleoside deaminase [Lactobacillaceae]|nr:MULTISPECIES: nucleoside deaminase [Lactobacillaceae]